MENIILTTPTVWILYLIALVLSIVGLVKRSWYILDFVWLSLAVGASAYALILGAAIYEVAAVLMLFLAIGLITFVPVGGWQKKSGGNVRHKADKDGTEDKKQ